MKRGGIAGKWKKAQMYSTIRNYETRLQQYDVFEKVVPIRIGSRFHELRLQQYLTVVVSLLERC